MKNIVIKGWMVAVCVAVFIFGGILTTMGTGDWTTTRERTPLRAASGEYDLADMRGSYSVAEIEEFFGVPAAVLFDAFRIPEHLRQPTFQVRDMKGLFADVIIAGEEIDVGADLVRKFVSLYAGRPYESHETTHIPATAAAILLRDNRLDADQLAYWQAQTFDLILVDAGAARESNAAPVAEAGEGGFEIRGRTTMGELLAQGLTAEQFEAMTGLPLPENPATTLKDFVDTNRLDMEIVREKILETLAH